MLRRAGAGLALLVLAASVLPGDDDSTAFLTAPQANLRGSPVDPPTVAVSATDGRYVAFMSYARLSPADTNDRCDIYVLDRTTRQVTLETPGVAEAGPAWPQLSGDGRFLVYEMTGRAAGAPRVIVLRDRWAETSRTMERPGVPANGSSRSGTVSADGRSVVFTSAATNLADGPDVNGAADDVYRFDVPSATFSRVSVGREGQQVPVGSSFAPAVSADGRFVAFSSTASLNGVAAAPRGSRPAVNVFVRDLTLGVTTRVSVRADGALPNAPSYDAAISADGRYIAFVSEATDLVRGDLNRSPDIFLFDTKTGTTELVSRSESGGSANGASSHPVISAAGTVVAFQSDASDLTCARRCPPALRDINLVADVFAFDVRTHALTRVSTGRTSWAEPSIGPAIDGTGGIIAFSSRHPRDSRDEGDDYDLFVRLPPK